MTKDDVAAAAAVDGGDDDDETLFDVRRNADGVRLRFINDNGSDEFCCCCCWFAVVGDVGVDDDADDDGDDNFGGDNGDFDDKDWPFPPLLFEVCCCCVWLFGLWLSLISLITSTGDDSRLFGLDRDGDRDDDDCLTWSSPSLSLPLSFVDADAVVEFAIVADVVDVTGIVVVAVVDDDDVDRLLFGPWRFVGSCCCCWFNGWFDIIDAKCDVKCAVHADSVNVCDGWCCGCGWWCCELKWPIWWLFNDGWWWWWCAEPVGPGDKFRFFVPLIVVDDDGWCGEMLFDDDIDADVVVGLVVDDDPGNNPAK